MKNLSEILKQDAVYLHNWSCKIDMIGDFENIYMSAKEYFAEQSPYPNIERWNESKIEMSKAIDRYKDINILFASYGTDNYSGDAFVLLEKDGKLCEVNGGHCSCMGLEGQFAPEETTFEAISFRLLNGSLGCDEYSDNLFSNELKEFIGL